MESLRVRQCGKCNARANGGRNIPARKMKGQRINGSMAGTLVYEFSKEF